MNVTQIIDQIIGRTDNVSTIDGDYARRRQRHLEYLIEEANYLYTAREWKWRRTSTTVTISSGTGFADLPTDFQSIGRQSLVTNTANGKVLRWASEDELRAEKDIPGHTTGDPDVYSIYDQSTDFEYRIQTVTVSQNVTLLVPYNKALPVLDEDASSGLNNIKCIPEHYHQTVLIPALRSLADFSTGKNDWQAHERQRERGLRLMIRQERLPQDTMGQFPSFFGGRTYGDA